MDALVFPLMWEDNLLATSRQVDFLLNPLALAMIVRLVILKRGGPDMVVLNCCIRPVLSYKMFHEQCLIYRGSRSKSQDEIY